MPGENKEQAEQIIPELRGPAIAYAHSERRSKASAAAITPRRICSTRTSP